jgi:DNA-binding PadR family transcriptional regulator
MQQNPGFMVLYSFIKDALLSKTGIVKVWWEEREQEERETYYDLTEDQFAMLAQAVMMSNGAMKIVEHTTNTGPQSGAPEAAGYA